MRQHPVQRVLRVGIEAISGAAAPFRLSVIHKMQGKAALPGQFFGEGSAQRRVSGFADTLQEKVGNIGAIEKQHNAPVNVSSIFSLPART